MAGKNKSVFGIYPDRITVEEAVDRFRAAGFRSADISVLFPESAGTRTLRTKGIRKRQRTQPPELERAWFWAAHLGG